MDSQNVVNTYYGIFFIYEKQWNADTWYIGEFWSHYIKWNKPVTKGQTVWIHLYEISRRGKIIIIIIILTQKREPRAGKGRLLGNRELLFNEWRVSIWDADKVQNVHSGDGCIILCIYSISLNCTLKCLKC